MAGQQRRNGDWVIQPESWAAPRTLALAEWNGIGQTVAYPLTVSGDWYNTAGDQMERYREMEASEVAVATRGDVWVHIAPLSERTWAEVLADSFSLVVIARISRFKSEHNDQNIVLIGDVDFRVASMANDTYVWQQMRHSTNIRVYDPAVVSTTVTANPALVHQFNVNARYARKLEGQDNMWLFVQVGIFHLPEMWDHTPAFVVPDMRFTVTPYLRTFIQ